MSNPARLGPCAILGIVIAHAACGQVQEKRGQIVYSSSCSDGGYAVSLQDLAKAPKSGGDGFTSAAPIPNPIVPSACRRE